MNFANPLKTDLAEYRTRQQLLERLRAENQNMISLVEKFYSLHARQQPGALQALAEMVAAFDRIITAGDWDSSLFLRNTIKPLRKMREEALQLREQLLGNNPAEILAAPILAPGMIKVYVAIFQHKAHNSKDWELQLRNLSHHVLGRPIYRDETAVQKALRAKIVQNTDAYVCVGVPESALQSDQFQAPPTDKQGNILLQLLPGAVKSENILEFVYQDKRYYFNDGRLVEVNCNKK